MGKQDAPFLVRIFFSSWTRFDRALFVARACLVGLWLGILTRENLHAIDEEFYSRSKRQTLDGTNYHSKEYNRRGLWEWENRAVADYFAGRKRLLVIAAGGGREVLALQRLGYRIDGFESHPDLVTAANELLREEGVDSTVRQVLRDEAPNTGTTYDGIIIGWGAYMLVQGRRRRIALLQKLRAQTRTQCPILLSFFHRSGSPLVFKVSVLVANMIRRVLRRELAEVGDWLAPEYVHHFTQDEIISELSEGEFNTVHFSTAGYGHAVGIAK